MQIIDDKCNGCIECCKYMTFQFHGEYEDDFQEFYKERGCEVKIIDDVTWVIVPFPCPRLTDTGCRDYANRPYPCKVFDGRNHPIAKEFCKIATD